MDADHNEYLCFTEGYDKDAAKDRFLERFHCQPKRWFVCDRLLWVGPVPEEGAGDD